MEVVVALLLRLEDAEDVLEDMMVLWVLAGGGGGDGGRRNKGKGREGQGGRWVLYIQPAVKQTPDHQAFEQKKER